MKPKTFKLSALLAVIIVALSACSSDEPVMPGPKYTTTSEITLSRGETACNDAFNAFSLQFFNKIYEKNSEDNFVISPVSMAITLSMIANAVDDNVRQSIFDVLDTDNIDETNSLSRKLMQFLPDKKNEATLTLANSLWYNKNLTPSEDIIKCISDYYFGNVEPFDFNSPSALTRINDWFRSNTYNLIPNAFSGLPAEIKLICLNAFYFNAQWDEKFDVAKTRQQTFHGLKSDATVAMMNRSFTTRYFDTSTWQAINIPYKGTNEMIVIQPKEAGDFATVAESIDMQSILDAKSQSELAWVTLSMPRFDCELAFDCSQTLGSLGINLLTGNSDNFSAYTDDDEHLAITFLQTTSLTTNEIGTQAASATAGILYNTSNVPSLRVDFKLDRPFIYLIRNKTTGSILLAGQFIQPAEE